MLEESVFRHINIFKLEIAANVDTSLGSFGDFITTEYFFHTRIDLFSM